MLLSVVFNVTMKNSSLTYPDVLVLLPNNFTAEQRAEFMDQLALGMVGDIIESPDNDLSADTDGDFTIGADAALLEAARQIASLNATSANLTAFWAAPDTDNTTSHQIYAVVRVARSRRGLRIVLLMHQYCVGYVINETSLRLQTRERKLWLTLDYLNVKYYVDSV